jgi:copper chaperone CopZ
MKTKLNITGMHCEHCVAAVADALGALVGVKKVKVNLKKGEGIVEHDDTVSLDAMQKAVASAGDFQATQAA